MAGRWSCLAVLLLGFCSSQAAIQGGMLHPRESESRQIQEMNGMWEFRADMSPSRDEGMAKKWYQRPLAESGPVFPMPVPSSYNDITADRELRDFVGWVWFEREMFVSSDWQNKRVVLRIDSAHYNTIVYVNGQVATEHSGGHLPFEVMVNNMVHFGEANRVTIAVNNTLTPHTLPLGSLTFHTDNPRYPPGYFVQNLQFDFFNYAGIHRRVRLYTTPTTYIDDITITTDVSGSTGVVNYDIKQGGNAQATVGVEVVDAKGQTVTTGTGPKGTVKIQNVRLWWPYTLNLEDPGYQYALKVTLTSSEGKDVYRQLFGVRTIKVTETQLLINSKPFYCHGAAKHEDSDLRGKGLDYPLIGRDFHMLKWLGANCFRTSHYPYAEEILDQADRQGIMVIDESPAVGLQTEENMDNITLAHHLEVMEELVRRDKNRPGVILWSIANEPNTGASYAKPYFKAVLGHVRQLDPSRPVTFVSSQDYGSDLAVEFVDVICFNRYYGWYQDTGHLETIAYQLKYDLEHWHDRWKKPLIITEYGADTVPGLHTLPSFVFTEDYQVEFMRQYHEVFDIYRKQYLVGEMVWNFADFMTGETDTRVVGNKKGVLTRQRQPKAAAHHLRDRYWRLVNETSPFTKIPDHLV